MNSKTMSHGGDGAPPENKKAVQFASAGGGKMNATTDYKKSGQEPSAPSTTPDFNPMRHKPKAL